jgi:hypothetical protein
MIGLKGISRDMSRQRDGRTQIDRWNVDLTNLTFLFTEIRLRVALTEMMYERV